MSDRSNIAWTSATWNPIRGCSRVSEGCRKCYAEVLAARHSYPGGWGEGIAKWVKRSDGTKEARWTGKVQTVEELLDAPLRWRAPRRVFVNSMSDLFHENVPDEFIADVFAHMAYARQHTFQVLTKRPERMAKLFYTKAFAELYDSATRHAGMMAEEILAARGEFNPLARRTNDIRAFNPCFPLMNVWLGVSIEDQPTAIERIPLLLRTPAAVRFVSAEPLLGHVNLRSMKGNPGFGTSPHHDHFDALHQRAPWRLHWVIIGGESGSGYRSMNMEHARSLIAQCKDAGVPTFVKQDSGPRPGMQGRFTDEEFAMKEYPA
jgi:protein gp37